MESPAARYVSLRVDIIVCFAQSATYDKAECKPRMLLDDIRAVVPTIVASTDYTLISLHFLAKGMFAAREYQAHFSPRLVRERARCS